MLDGQWSMVVEFARSQVGKPYDWRSVFRFLTREKAGTPGRWFCSELVVAALERGGVRLLNMPAWAVAPGHLAWSTRLRRVDDRRSREARGSGLLVRDGLATPVGVPGCGTEPPILSREPGTEMGSGERAKGGKRRARRKPEWAKRRAGAFGVEHAAVRGAILRPRMDANEHESGNGGHRPPLQNGLEAGR